MFKLYEKQIYTVFSIVFAVLVLFVIYTIFKRIKGGAQTIGDIASDTAENLAISKQTGVSLARIKTLRNSAYKIAYELETLQSMSMLDKLSQVSEMDVIISALNEAKSYEEMTVLRALYKNEFSGGNEVLKDIEDRFWLKNDLDKVKFINALY